MSATGGALELSVDGAGLFALNGGGVRTRARDTNAITQNLGMDFKSFPVKVLGAGAGLARNGGRRMSKMFEADSVLDEEKCEKAATRREIAGDQWNYGSIPNTLFLAFQLRGARFFSPAFAAAKTEI